ncbi:MAG: HD-GYP domain-containing protein [Acidimicrobiales bacterium]
MAGPPISALVLRIVIVVLPIAVAVGFSLGASYALPTPVGTGEVILWWVAVLATSAAIMLAGEVLARRVLPLVALLRLSLLFPGPAPSRVAVSRRSSRRDLRALADRVREHGLGDDAHEAATTLIRLIGALDVHDRRTRGHSERVRALTDLLAETPAPRRRRSQQAAMGGPVARHRQARRSHGGAQQTGPAERGGVGAHPSAPGRGRPHDGRAAGVARRWAPVVLQHHERWDGEGYPQGLAGEDISYGARIVAVADAYDVMTSVRTYQPRPKSQAAALEEVVACSGTQFDPAVARTMVNVSTRRLWVVLGPLAWLAQNPAAGTGRHCGPGVAGSRRERWRRRLGGPGQWI